MGVSRAVWGPGGDGVLPGGKPHLRHPVGKRNELLCCSHVTVTLLLRNPAYGARPASDDLMRTGQKKPEVHMREMCCVGLVDEPQSTT